MAVKPIKRPVVPMTIEGCDAEIIKFWDKLQQNPRDINKWVEGWEQIDRMLDCRLAIMREEEQDAVGD